MKKIKNIISLFVFITVLCAFAFSMQASAAKTLSQTFKEGTYYYTVTDKKATITDADVKGVITVPDTLGGYPVVAVGDSAFDYLDKLEKVTIPGSIKTIGKKAFTYCENLHTVIMQEGVEEIGEYAFYCFYEWEGDTYDNEDKYTGHSKYSSLNSVALPDSIKVIADRAFSATKLSGTLTLPKSLEKLGKYAFGNTSISTVYIPAQVKYSDEIHISSYGFNLDEYYSTVKDAVLKIVTEPGGDYSVTEDGLLLLGKDETVAVGYFNRKAERVTLPDSVKVISAYCFEAMKELDTVIMPNVEVIKEKAFYDCKNFDSVTFNDSLTTIGDYAFANCNTLCDVNIPSKLTEIGERAFYGTKIAGDIVFPATLKEIGERAFEDCIALTGVSFTGDVKIGNSAFYSCKALTKAEFEPTSSITLGSKAFVKCNNLKALALPEGKVVLGSELFMETGIETFEINTSDLTAPEDLYSGYDSSKGKLKKIVIGKNVNALNANALDCASVRSIVIDKENKTYITEENAIYNKVKTELIRYFTPLEDYYDKVDCFVVPDTVKVISDKAFSHARVDKVNLGKSVEKIGSYAFCYSKVSGKFVLPENVTTIGKYAFAHSRIRECAITGTKIKKLASNMFASCSLLKEIYYVGSRESFNSFATITEGSYFWQARKHYNTDGENHPYTKVLEKQGNFKEGGFYSNTCKCGNTYNTYFDPIGEIVISYPYTLPSDEAVRVIVLDDSKNTVSEILVEGVDYTYTVAPSSKVDGECDFKFTFKGRYTGKCTVTRNVKVAGVSKITAKLSGLKANLTWSAVKGATGYKLYRYDYTANKWKLIADTKKTSYTDKGLAASTGYRYMVKTYINYKPLGNVVSSKNAKVNVATPSNGLKATVVNSTSVKLSWSKVKGATGYRIFVRNETADKWNIAVKTTGKATSYTFKNLKPGKKYIYAVRSYVNNNGKIVWAPTYISASATIPPKTVTGLKMSEYTYNTITLKWNKTTASGYRVFVYDKSAKKWKTVVSSTTATTATIKDLKIGTEYIFAVRPFVSTGKDTVWSETYTKITTSTKLSSVSLRSITTKKGTVTLSWNKSSGVTGYQVWYSTNKTSGYKKLSNYKVTSATQKNLKVGKTYYYRVRAYKAVGGSYVYSAWSDIKSIKIK